MDQIGTVFQAQETLAEVVRHFYCIRTPEDFIPATQHLAPNFEMMLVFNFGQPFSFSFAQEPTGAYYLEKVGLLGPLRKMLNYDVLPGADLLITVFNLHGFYRVFKQPVDSMPADVLLDPDSFIDNASCKDLWQVLKNVHTQEERVQILNDYISALIQPVDNMEISIKQAVHYFQDVSLAPVKALAADTDTSERTIQLRFKKYVGYSPRELLRFLRFKEVINRLQQTGEQEVNWFDYIHEFGYHDQSHLIKDFQHYLGTTPQQFLKQLSQKGFCITQPGQHYT